VVISRIGFERPPGGALNLVADLDERRDRTRAGIAVPLEYDDRVFGLEQASHPPDDAFLCSFDVKLDDPDVAAREQLIEPEARYAYRSPLLRLPVGSSTEDRVERPLSGVPLTRFPFTTGVEVDRTVHVGRGRVDHLDTPTEESTTSSPSNQSRVRRKRVNNDHMPLAADQLSQAETEVTTVRADIGDDHALSHITGEGLAHVRLVGTNQVAKPGSEPHWEPGAEPHSNYCNTRYLPKSVVFELVCSFALRALRLNPLR
jgi:hypothetical protein